MATIRNKRTGEVRTVDETELPSYGITPSEAPKKKGKILGGKIPLAGGILGTIGGGIAGNIPGSIAGAGIGAGAGVALENLLEDLLGQQQETPGQQLAQAGKEIVTQGAGAALGGIGGKLLSKLFNPIRSLAGLQDIILKRSPRSINVGETVAPGAVPSVLEKLKSESLPALSRRGMGTEAVESLNRLIPDVASAVSSLRPHIPAESIKPGVDLTAGKNVAALKLPHFQANVLKREFGKGISENYGKLGTAEEELRKGFVRLLGQEISRGQPAISLTNLLMRGLYLPQAIGNQISYAGGLLGPSGYYTGRALGALGNLPGKALGKLGDIAPYLLPPTLQSSFRNFGQEQ